MNYSDEQKRISLTLINYLSVIINLYHLNVFWSHLIYIIVI